MNNSSPSFFAKRIEKQVLPPPQTMLQKQGLAYERRVVKALRAKGLEVEHNPWFEWRPEVPECFQKIMLSVCCPDILIYGLFTGSTVVVEVKLSATLMALTKLKKIYCPIVSAATGVHTLPLVISKHVTKATLNDSFFNSNILTAVNSSSPIYLWSGKGPIT